MNATKTLFGILSLTAALTMTGRSQSCAPVISGLADWWPGEGNADDVTGLNNGTIPDPVDVTFAAGEVGQAFAFSGISPNTNDTGNEVDFGSNAGNFGTNNFTIDFWIEQPTNATGLYGVLEKRVACGTATAFLDIHCGHQSGVSVSTAGRFFMDMSGNGTANYGIVFATNKMINDGNFHHAAFVRSNLTLSIYIDGVLDNSSSVAGIANISNSAVFRAGQSTCVGVDGSQPFVGKMDELDLYDRALSPTEIYAIYHAGASGKCGMPIITTQPQSVLVDAHATVSFSVAATWAQGYQWSLNSNNIGGATSSTLTVSNVTQTNLGNYAVVVTNSYGSVISSNAMLSMYPYIEAPFTGAVTYWGQNATLGVQAWGTGPLSYQWLYDGEAIDGATNQTLMLTTIQATNAGLYSVVISNSFGGTTNTPEQVVVEPAGVSLGFSPNLTISGVAGYSYTIQRTTNLADTNAWITVTNLTLTQAVQLWVDTNVDALSPFHPMHFYQVLPGQ